MPEQPIEALEARVGETHVVVEDLAVEAGKVEEFARAVGEDNPAFRDADAAATQGFDAIPAPPTFTRIGFFPRYHPDDETGAGVDLGFDERYIVHGEQEYEFERPARVGDVLTGEATLTDVYQREGSRGGEMTFAVVETEYRDQDGDLVLTERRTVIETGGAIEEDDA